MWFCNSYSAAGPPTNFPGIRKSCLNQTNLKIRSTKKATSAAREENQRKNEEEKKRCLPNDKLVRNLLSRTSDDNNLGLFNELKPEQRKI